MKKIFFTVLALLSIYILPANELSDSINRFINNKPADSGYEIDKECLFSSKLLRQFYQNRNYTPAWTKTSQEIWINTNIPSWINDDSPVRLSYDSPVWVESHILGKNGFDLLDYIRQIDQHGLNPNDYHLAQIEKYIDKTTSYLAMDTEEVMKLDVLLSDAFLLVGLQMYYGKVDSEKENGSWKALRKEPELRFDSVLEEGLAANDIANALNLLTPRYPSYWMMKKDLAFFLGLQRESWPAILSDTIIKPGESNNLLPKIRKRLQKLRYPISDSGSINYDEEFGKQLMMFQKDWGLNPDGAIGHGTLLALNTNPTQLINKIKVNMERFRWLPLKKPPKYIIVNIANFDLAVIEGSDTLISMRAIVGNDYRKTPVFSARMTYIVFGPTWTVPPTILQNDVVPELLRDPGYLKNKDMKLLRHDGSEIAYNDVDWSKISKNSFPYMVRQNPGPHNALGKVKFMFPNIYNVYIHDTPSRGYFVRDDRAMSSGCIRIEKPFELAKLLLSDSHEWTPDKISAAMQQNREQTAGLKTPVELMILYLTAWTEGNGRVQFRKDIYQRDTIVLSALNQKPEPEKIKAIPF